MLSWFFRRSRSVPAPPADDVRQAADALMAVETVDAACDIVRRLDTQVGMSGRTSFREALEQAMPGLLRVVHMPGGDALAPIIDPALVGDRHRGGGWRPPPVDPRWVEVLQTCCDQETPETGVSMARLGARIVPDAPHPAAPIILARLTREALAATDRGMTGRDDSYPLVAIRRWVTLAGHDAQPVRDAFVQGFAAGIPASPIGCDQLVRSGFIDDATLRLAGQPLVDLAVAHLDAGGATWLARLPPDPMVRR